MDKTPNVQGVEYGLFQEAGESDAAFRWRVLGGEPVRTDGVVTARGFWRLVEAFDAWDARMAPADDGATTEEATMCKETEAMAGQAMGNSAISGAFNRREEGPGRATHKGALACVSCGAAMWHGRGAHGDFVECGGQSSCDQAGRRFDPPVVYLDPYGMRARDEARQRAYETGPENAPYKLAR